MAKTSPTSQEEDEEEVLFETRRHASRPYSPNYPPQQLDHGGNKGFLSLLSIQGLSRLRDRWNAYGQPRRLKRLASIFVSPKGEHVAVAVGNQITILRKVDDYQDPCGSFTGVGTFLYGTWSESHNVLGAVDDGDTLYLLKANGEEIIRIERRHFKLVFPIIGLLVFDDAEKEGACLCSFNFLTSDASLHHIEISQDLSASISSIHTIKREFPHNVFCLDYNRQHSLLVLVGRVDGAFLSTSSGIDSCSLSLWRCSRNSDVQHVTSSEFEGLYMIPKGYTGAITSTKVLMSSEAKFIAALDVRGCLTIFKLDEDLHSLLIIDCGENHNTEITNNVSTTQRKCLDDIVDFTWWSDYILTLVKRSGVVSMFNIISGKESLVDDHVYSMPSLERLENSVGVVFLLHTTSPEGTHISADALESSNLHVIGQVAKEKLDKSRLLWSLISFSKRSVPEMYEALIKNKRYESALEFASRHNLDKDKVWKAQWLHSEQGTNDISMILSNVKDETFKLGECVEKVGPTEDSVKALLAFGLHLTDSCNFPESEDDTSDQTWDFLLLRLQLLQFKDRLETFLGINMGRFSVQEYSNFRVMPIKEAAVKLAENGKIGALNLLFKRHPYSLAPFMLEVLSAIPETVPVQMYNQLLPGRSPPNVALRGQDWVEGEKMVKYIRGLPEDGDSGILIRTEAIIKQLRGFSLPAIEDIFEWYKDRARYIDKFSGQLDNCLYLVNSGLQKGIFELQQFFEDISYLQHLIYSETGESETVFSFTITEWEHLPDYEKFRAMLKDVKEENVVERLRERAISFMKNRSRDTNSSLDAVHQMGDPFLVRWLKEMAAGNNIEICLPVIEEGCGDLHSGFFRNEMEAVDCALGCIYSCSATDRWGTMACIMLKLHPFEGTDNFERLEERIKVAEGHIEAGRLLALYQVPKQVSFFLESHKDEKGVKQLLRLILSKFIRRQPGRSDIDWASMWNDLLYLQEKSFPFIDLEYLLIEFCRGLLKAGKFTLARNYLKGTGSLSLPAEKVENLVIQTAREYFFSASSLACPEIWKAKECLDLFPSSRSVKAEADIITALTVKLPNLGVHILPMQYKQILDPMEIIKMAFTSQAGSYLNVDELIEVARLLGLDSHEDVCAVQEAIAREAAVAGDLQLAFDLCTVLARKGHGPVWDLCAAIARGPEIENMDIISRKQLLGFALSHCDDESIGELLHAWKDLDMHSQSELLMVLSQTSPPNFIVEGPSLISLPGHSSQQVVPQRDFSVMADGLAENDYETHPSKIKAKLGEVARDLPFLNGSSWDSLLRENGKVLSFAALNLPWLVDLSGRSELGKKFPPANTSAKHYVSIRTQSLITILSWLARFGFAPRDDLIASLARSVMDPPVTKEEDVISCAFLLNLIDAFQGVEIIEEQLKTREDYQEISSIMNVGMTYSLLHNSEIKTKDPWQRRDLLLKKFREKIGPDELDKLDKSHSTFWIGWKVKLEEQKRMADHTRVLEELIPGVETARFLSGDVNYIRSVIFSVVESVKSEKKHIMDVLTLADSYNLNRSEVLLKFLSSALVSDAWTNEEITTEILEFQGEILAVAEETINIVTCIVYPAIDGCNKTRLAHIYGLLSDCYMQLERTKDSQFSGNPAYGPTGLAHFYRVLEQECNRISYIRDLNFKNIADIGGLNVKHFNREVCDLIDEYTVEALAKMVQTLVSAQPNPVTEVLISWRDVYKYQIMTLFKNLEDRVCQVENPESLQGLLADLEQTYDISRKHIPFLEGEDALTIMRQYFNRIIPAHVNFLVINNELMWKDCLVVFLNFWVRLTNDMQEIASEEKLGTEVLITCIKVLLKLVMEGKVTPSQGWGIVYGFANNGAIGDPAVQFFYFCSSMVLSGCRFAATESVFSEVTNSLGQVYTFKDISALYGNILDSTLQGLVEESREHLNLNNLLSSLSSSEGELGNLKTVRHAVWQRLANFSEKLELPSHIRVHILELMQYILGRNFKSPAEPECDILRWEGWEEWHQIHEKSEVTSDQALPSQSDRSSRFGNTLVALKSTQLASVISPSLEITPDDLMTVDSAVSCFSKLCNNATSDSDFDALLAILGKWENLFAMEKTKEPSPRTSDTRVSWSDDWDDEGWESFETVEKENEESALLIHPLHACWTMIIEKLLTLSRFSEILKIVDQNLGKSNWELVNEDEARTLIDMMLKSDCFMALKVALFLPYEPIRLYCLDTVEEKLKEGGFPDMCNQDQEFLILVMSSGVVSTVISKSSYGATFSYLCYLVGNYSRRCQDSLLLRLSPTEKDAHDPKDEEFCLLFKKVLFLCFVSELVVADQQILAGFLVTKFMHTNAALSLINIAEASLSRYLKMQLQALDGDNSLVKEVKSSQMLGHAVSALKVKLKSLVHSALSSLPGGHL
ncbi:hypothetical protein Dimus_000106 [Dionaea muscipula]